MSARPGSPKYLGAFTKEQEASLLKAVRDLADVHKKLAAKEGPAVVGGWASAVWQGTPPTPVDVETKVAQTMREHCALERAAKSAEKVAEYALAEIPEAEEDEPDSSES